MLEETEVTNTVTVVDFKWMGLQSSFKCSGSTECMEVTIGAGRLHKHLNAAFCVLLTKAVSYGQLSPLNISLKLLQVLCLRSSTHVYQS